MNELATDKQLKLMDKMNLPYDIHRTTKHEASEMIDKAMRGQNDRPTKVFKQYPDTQNLIVAQVAAKCAVDLEIAGKIREGLTWADEAQQIYNWIFEVAK